MLDGHKLADLVEDGLHLLCIIVHLVLTVIEVHLKLLPVRLHLLSELLLGYLEQLDLVFKFHFFSHEAFSSCLHCVSLQLALSGELSGIYQLQVVFVLLALLK